MSSLLSPFNFGQKHAYFHAKITIHELVNVPLVTGHFKARWRVKNVHGLQNIPGTMSHSSHNAAEDNHHQHGHHHHHNHDREASTGTTSVDDLGISKSLHHQKSLTSIASRDKGNQSGASSRDDLRDSGEHTRERKTSNRFLAGFKEAFHSKSRRSTSNSHGKEEHGHVVSPLAGGDSSIPSDSRQHNTSREDLIVPRGEGQAPAPRRQGSVKSIAAESDSSHKRASFHSSKGHTEKDSLGTAAANQASLMMQAEPKGETSNEKIRDHVIKWERKVEVGVRIAVEKQKPNDKTNSSTPVATASGALTPSGHYGGENGPGAMLSSTSTIGNRSSFSANKDGSSHSLKGQPSHRSLADRSDADSRHERVERDAKERDKDRDLVDAWGMLESAELKITIRGDIPTDTSGSTNAADSHVSIGHVIINLAEFAPFPESSAHQHHHHQHPAHVHHHSQTQHSHHHYHLHHHHVVLSRSETRRYLLSDSRMNATLKLTIELTHMGGSREYAVPAVRRGLIVGGISSIVNGSEDSHRNHRRKGTSGSTASDSNHGSTEGHGRDDRSHIEGNRSQSQSHNASVASIVHNPISSWPDNSVAKHARIPASNLRTELSHQDAARAVREAGGHRMGFSFGAGAHHEKPPEEVIESLFNPSNTLSNRASKGKLRRTSSRESKKNDKLDRAKSLSILPIESSRDGSQGPTSPLSRFPPRSASEDDKKPTDSEMTPSSSQRTQTAVASPGESASEEGRKRGHKSTPSNSTMRSILTNSLSSKVSLHQLSNNPDAMHSSSSGTNSSDSAQTPFRRSSIGHNLSKGPSLVRWDASVTAADGTKAPSSTVPPSPSQPPELKGLIIPQNTEVTASPSLMSQRASQEVSPIEQIKPSAPMSKAEEDGRDAFLALCAKTEDDDKLEDVNIAPPNLPPDVARREAYHIHLKNHQGTETNGLDSSAFKASRGLSKEEALEKGYRGVGWGTLDLIRGPGATTPSLDVYPSSENSSPASHTRELLV